MTQCLDPQPTDKVLEIGTGSGYQAAVLSPLVDCVVLVVGGVVVAVWGMGPAIGLWLVLLGGLMIALTWPTARKTQLLLGRVRALRGGDRDSQ